jgi:hypothetical protein
VPQENAGALLITTEPLAAYSYLAAENALFSLFRACSQQPIRQVESFDEFSPAWNS